MSASVGLDMIAVPGKTSPSTLAGIIADEMAIGMVNQKTTAVRLIPVIGKDVGETAEFGGLLGYAPIMRSMNSDARHLSAERAGYLHPFIVSRTDRRKWLWQKWRL